ncbi:uncharacterized protein LOC132746434 [Ruditapes philippinarum]|uniref:uncharacterized protein LOC132746434 n=1 Tax=Ruditapes philippinarum TaxID=129788 RepID=UPI00295B6C9C|nr:uncharacterized protein LOC132746434 [Ruditapes philippinarum]
MECKQYASEHNISVAGESLNGSKSSVSQSKDSANKDSKTEKLDVKSNFVLPADCLTAVSMPRNWSQVERLKQQRLLLHQQLFSQKLIVKNDENFSEMLEENAGKEDKNGNLIKLGGITDVINDDSFQDLKTGQSFENHSVYNAKNGFDDETDSSDSGDFIPRLRIAESCTVVENKSGVISNTDTQVDLDEDVIGKSEEMNLDREKNCSEHVTIEGELDENESSQNSLNNSDLCDISASKINEALFNTICSVSENKKQKEYRIKEVLNSLKIQAEVKEYEHEQLGYKIEKPLPNAPKMPSNLGCVSVMSNNNCSAIKHFPDSILKVVKSSSNMGNLSPTQYVGLPVDVESISRQYSTCTERLDNLSSTGMKQKKTTIIDYGSTDATIKEPDYRNIALQKMLALKRLGVMEEQGQKDIHKKSVASINQSYNGSSQKLQSQTKNVHTVEKQENSEHFDLVKQVSSIPKKRKLSLEEKELCMLKQEVLSKRMQTHKLDSCEIKKQMLNAEQKMFEAKQKVLQAELKISEHKLKMAEQGYFFPRRRFYQRYCLSSGLAIDDSTDTDEELIDNERRNSESRMSSHGSESAAKDKNPQEKKILLRNSEEAHETKNSKEKIKTAIKNKISQFKVMSANKNEANETKNQLDQPITENKDESGQKKLENDQLDKFKIVTKMQPDFIIQNGAKHKRSCLKSCTSSKTKAGESNSSRTISPVQPEINVPRDVEIKSVTASVSPTMKITDSQPNQQGIFFALNSSVNNRSSVNNQLHLSRVSVTSHAKTLVLPTSAVLQNALKNQTAIMPGIQRQSQNANQSRHTDTLILPSGYVRDESSNQIFHTYHFNGQTFAMIDNKLYQIHLKSTDGKTKTVIGALIPTTASKSPVSARAGLAATEITRNLANVYNRNTTLPKNVIQALIPTNTSVQASQKPIVCRFPVYSVPSAGQPNKPLNLLIAHTSPNDTVTQSTQVIRQPLMHAFGSNNTVRAHLQQVLGQKAYTTSPMVVNPQKFGRDSIRCPVTLTQTTAFQYGNHSFPKTSIPQDNKKQQKSPIESNYVRPTNPFINHQTISPRTAKSLLTNKTYVVVNTSPEKISQLSVQSKRKIEYCGSVILSSASNSSVFASQVTPNSTSIDKHVTVSISKSAEPKAVSTLSTVTFTEQNGSGQGLNDSASEGSDSKTKQGELTKAVNETTVVEPSKENCHRGVSSQGYTNYVLRSQSPATICSSMDSFIYTSKRKRKGTPLKTVFDENSSLPPKVQKVDENLHSLKTKEIEKDICLISEKGVSEEKSDKLNNEKITEPVPFLDYPARIVSTNKSGGKTKLIVASPKDTVKSGQSSDTSLDEEKIAKMISFANQLEEKSNEKEPGSKKIKRKRLLKKRVSEDVQEMCSKENSTTDSEHESEKSFNKTENQKADKIETLNHDIEPKQSKDEANLPGDSEHAVSIVEKNQKIGGGHKDRNMFDELEQFVSKQSLMSESCNESSSSYDSSDLETYEKFVSKRKMSDVRKPKSQFMESYFTNQGMKELKSGNMESNNSTTGFSITSKSNLKEMDLKIVPQRNTPKEVEMEIVDSNLQNKTLPSQKTSFCSKSSSDVAEIRQEVGPLEVKCSSAGDMAVHSIPDVTKSLSEINQRSFTVSGKQVKKLIKTKFIILKGDICDRWFDIKRKTGFSEMSDPKFIHYLLRSEDERQTKKTKITDASVQTDRCSNLDRNQANRTETSLDCIKVDPDRMNYNVNMNSNNNADSFLDDKTAVSDEDFEATIVNVTDTPLSSPMLSDISTPDCETSTRNTCFLRSPKFTETASISSHEKHSDVKSEISHEMISNALDRVLLLPDGPDHSRKRHIEEEGKEGPAAKKQYPILSCATQRQMQWAVSLFREWLKEKGDENTEFESMSSTWLNDKLAKFYTDALSHEGTPYSTNILQTFRRALSLYLTSNCSSQNVRISISQDLEYNRSNEILTELVFTETQQNNGTVIDNVSYPITEEDMKKLYTTRTLSDDDPTSLMWKVWFDITFHLCKGNLPRNFWRSLTKHSLVLESDVNGVFYSFADYVYIPADEQPGKMYATPNEPEKCPVRSTSFYLSKLCANCDALFQCSKRSWHKFQERWYLPVPVSRDKLDKIMSKISEHAQLSMVYDSTCVILTAKLKKPAKD